MTDGDQPPNAVIDHATTPPQVLCRECAYASVEDSEAIEELSDDQIGEVCICSSCGRDIADDLEENVVTDGGVDEQSAGIQQTYGMTFADKHVESIESGEKTLTARLGPEYSGVYERDIIQMWAANGAHIADTVVKNTNTLSAEKAWKLLNLHSGHRSYATFAEFQDAMREYYSDMEIDHGTDVHLIHFEVPAND